LKNFPVSISEIALSVDDAGESRLGFKLKVAFAGDKTPIQADTRLEIIGGMSTTPRGGQKWKFKKLGVETINLNATMAEAFSLEGHLNLLNDDPVYGDGFAGDITLDLKKGIEVKVKVRAIFGIKEYRYWLVDGSAEFSPGLVVFPPAVKLRGFGGGAYYKMRPQGTSRTIINSCFFYG
jgi:hypothetical protein